MQALADPAVAVITLNDSTISGNTVESGGIGGAGIEVYLATAILTNSTISDNHADWEYGTGGGIEDAGAAIEFKSSIIAGNSLSATGPGPGLHCTFKSYGCNLIQDISGATIVGDTTGNITGEDPLLAHDPAMFIRALIRFFEIHSLMT